MPNMQNSLWGCPKKNILSPCPYIYPWPLLGSMRSVIKTKNKIRPNNNKDVFSSHFSSYIQPKTIPLQYESIVFGWTYEPHMPPKICLPKYPTIVFTTKNCYTHLYWATLAHSDYSGTYLFRFGLKIAIFRVFWSPVWPLNHIFRENEPHHHF